MILLHLPKVKNFGLGCDRLGILETSTDGLSDIICNRRSIVKYSADENRYILLE